MLLLMIHLKNYMFMLEESYMIKKFKGLSASYVELGVSYKRYAVLNVERGRLSKYMVGMFTLICFIVKSKELIISCKYIFLCLLFIFEIK